MNRPTLTEERKLWKRGYKNVVCVDEVGRGSIVGPVIAAAAMVSLNLKAKSSKLPSRLLREIKDSKKLSPKKREEIYNTVIKNPVIKWGIGGVSEKIIDKINIQNATELAMARALDHLRVKNPRLKVDLLIIDGNRVKNLKLKNHNLKFIVKADEKVFSCAVASIIAKVKRDRMMLKIHKNYPQYGINRHKGYLTRYHQKMLQLHGPSVIHRKSFLCS